jgi:hypothetical protein
MRNSQNQESDGSVLVKSTARRLANGIILGLLSCALFHTKPVKAAELDDAIVRSLVFAQRQLEKAVRTQTPKLTDSNTGNDYPFRTRPDGTWAVSGPNAWYSGFFPGCLWLIYQRTSSPTWRTWAQNWTAPIESQKSYTGDHNGGFRLFPSFGQGYRLTGNQAYRQVVLTTAQSIASRYNARVGCIRSRGNISDTDFQVVVDNMPTLETLFWASKNGGNRAWYDMAVSHALKTMQHHIRPDGGSYQLVGFNSNTGAVVYKMTRQGHSNESTWSRGQAWLIYGFTMCYRETRDSRFLQAARKTADYFIDRLPADRVPYWDFQAPNIPNEPKDSSAAAIAVSGLVELSTLDPDAAGRQKYLSAAQGILSSLTSRAYLSEGTNSSAVLQHGTYHKLENSYDTGLIFGDYYFIEAMLRYQARR